MYDLSCMTFSPDGKVFQVEYAGKAVENSETIIGVLCKDGVILASEKLIVSKMLVEGTNKRIYHIHDDLGMVIGGRIPDGKNIVHRARQEAQSYKQNYGIDMSGSVLTDRISQYVHTYTLYYEYRPFGSSVITASYDEFDGYSLYMIEPSGQFLGYYGCATGKGKQIAKSHLDKTDFRTMTCKEALFHVAKMLHLCHEEFKEKKFEIEMSWICDETKHKHQIVPKDLQKIAEEKALAAIEQEEMGE